MLPPIPLNAEDAALLCAQTAEAPLMIGALCLFEGGEISKGAEAQLPEIRTHIESRLIHLPRFRQRLAPPPFGFGSPVWVDDVDFDVAHHVRLGSVPGPGGQAELRSYISDLLERPLDPKRPLWELWIVDGIQGGRVAVLPKVSHVMADGIALLDFAAAVLDPEPDTAPGEPEPWTPDPMPSTASVIACSWRERIRRQVATFGSLATGLSRPGPALSTGREVLGFLRRSARLAPTLPITAPVGTRRDFVWFDLPLDDLRAVEHGLGVTLNDVVLAIVTGALRESFTRSYPAVGDAPARVLVPVSLHPATDARSRPAATENRFSMLLAELPTTIADPVERVRRVHEEMSAHKQSDESRITSAIYRVTDLLPQWLLQAVAPPVIRRQPFVNLAVTNLPGSPTPMYFLGAQLVELFPFVTVTGNIALIIGVVSYAGHLGVGITVDPDVVTDVDSLAQDIQNAASELIAAAVPTPACNGLSGGSCSQRVVMTGQDLNLRPSGYEPHLGRDGR